MAKLDGTNWTVYNTSNSGLPSNSVGTIAIDENGTKWIGTVYDGLAEFDGTNWTIYNTSNSGLPNNEVLTIVIDVNDTKWIGTWQGLAVFNESGIPNSVNENIKSIDLINIYPNPSNDFINIELFSGMNISIVEIVNIQGKLVKIHELKTNKKTIDIRDLSDGMYIIKMHTDRGLVMEKFIKQ